MKRTWLGLLLTVACLPAFAAVVGREVDYKAGETTLKGYIAYDDAVKGPRPGVLVVHEWWGHNDYARKRADMLAALGYVALAVDMYGDGRTAAHPDDAGKFAGEVMKNTAAGEARFRAGSDFLRAQPQTDTNRIAAIGYCFGGAVVLHMARIGEPLVGVASFHGNLSTQKPAGKGAVRARVLVCHGEDDILVPPEQVKTFENEMTDAGARFKVILYKGAKHSFTNPDADKFARDFNLPVGYDEDADQQSWSDMKAFLREAFNAQP